MARRNISPVRVRSILDPGLPTGLDERDVIIRKLKEDLVMARSKEK